MSVPLLCSAFDFYSRPCGRGDVHRPASAHHLAISTHAPAGGATRRLIHVRLVTNISTHAPAGGATLASTQTSDKSSNFYSRPCGRGDPACSCAQPDLPISTHAPAGGATLYPRIVDGEVLFLLTPLREGRRHMRVMSTPPIYHFYSRPCGRGDHRRQAGLRRPDTISTHAPAGGATRAGVRAWLHADHFYSRPCGRGDNRQQAVRSCILISTHAPAGGATRTAHTAVNGIDISTHAPAGGATVFDEFSVSDDARRFLLTPLREGRHDRALLYEMPKIISTHAPAGGATSSRNPCVCTGLYFYSRPCGRGDR